MGGRAHGRRRTLADDARAIGEPVVAERPGSHHVDIDAAAAEPIGEIGGEPAGEVVLSARVGRRQEDDLHCGAGADGRTLFQRRMKPPGRHVAMETA